jgi:hypothetical protein
MHACARMHVHALFAHQSDRPERPLPNLLAYLKPGPLVVPRNSVELRMNKPAKEDERTHFEHLMASCQSASRSSIMVWPAQWAIGLIDMRSLPKKGSQ